MMTGHFMTMKKMMKNAFFMFSTAMDHSDTFSRTRRRFAHAKAMKSFLQD
jgi:hypothetical protein